MPAKKNRTVKKSPISKESKSTERVESGTKLFPIVGIGASAGGLEAFSLFLKNLPANTGMGFVFIQHQDPTHQSALPEILKKVTKLPVSEAAHGMPVEPDHIYVIPTNTSMTIIKGTLRLNPRANQGPHMPINSFFQSLAEFRQNKAIGVILSGTASDGTLGLKAINAVEGITFAQDQRSAKYDGMPSSAIAAGVVDFVLPPDQIAAEIARIGTHPFVKLKKLDEASLPIEGDSLAAIFGMVRKSTGVDFTHYKPTTVMHRISRRMLLHKVEDLKAYANYLKSNPKEINALYEDILINVTSFFRDPETFEILKNEIFPKLLKKSSDSSTRIWVPGCSTGEEAYSVAIALIEYLGDKSAGSQIQIFATDISEKAIDKARSGMFSNDIASDVRSDRLARFFVKTEQGYQVHKMIRDICVFAKHNVVKDPPFSRLDLISCRNLLIYFGPVLQKKVIPVFHYALNSNGFLLLGNTESIGGFSDYFYPADKKFRIFSKKSHSSKLHFEHETFLPRPHTIEVHSENVPLGLMEKDILKEGDRLILSKYAPASVIVNEDLQILQFRGRTGPYLEPSPGQASLNLLKMAREGLAVELRSALIQAKKDNAPVKINDLQLHSDGDLKKFTLEVIPFSPAQSSELFFLVLFDAISKPSKELLKSKVAAKKRTSKEQTEVQLRQELSATKDYLQAIIEQQEATNEELRAANEEILSSNEELQSTNEEMETAKEELQSANEELLTVNEEMQIRNAELSVANNDLSNLLASIQIPILIVGRDLRIRKFTPKAEKMMNLIPTDVGRLITDINLELSPSKLEEWVTDVVENVRVKEVDVQDRSGRWHELQIRPYITLDNKIDGAVLVLIDIDVLKRDVTEFQKYQSYCEAVVDTMQRPLILLDERLKVKMANEKFYEMFKVSRKETLNQDFYALGNGQWDIRDLRELLHQILPKRTIIENYPVDQHFPNIGQRKLLLSACRLDLKDIKERLIMIQILEGDSSPPY